MGLFDRFRKSEEPKRKAISIEEAEVILSKELDVLEFSPTFVQIKKAKEEAMKSLEKLRDAKFGEDIDKRLQNVIDGARGAFFDKVFVVVDDIMTSGNDLNKVNNAYKSIVRAIEVSNKNMHRYANKVSMGFDKQLRGFSNSFSRFNRIVERMKEKLDDKNKGEVERLKKLEAIQDYERVGGIVEELSSDVKELKNRIKVAETKLSDVESKSKQLESSKKTLKLNSIKADIKLLEDKMSGIRRELNVLRNAIEKGLKAYKKDVEGTGAARLIDSFMEEPLGVFKSRDSADRFALIVEGIRKQVESGKMKLKQKRRNKILKAIKDANLTEISKSFMKTSEELGKKKRELESCELVEQRMSLAKSRDNFEEKLLEMRNRKQEIERALSDKKRELDRLKMKVHKIVSEL
jgi:hypothetical protein